MSNLTVVYVLDKLLLEQDFSKTLEKAIENIMKDGKIDQYDIPEIILIIGELVTRTPSLNLSSENLTDIIKKLFDLLCTKYNLIQDENQKETFERLLESSIKLFLINPAIKEKTKKCWNFFTRICNK
jgi:hypothetical protein